MEIWYYLVIYDLVDDVKVVVFGLLSVEVCENFIGYVEIKEVFWVFKVGNVVGCLVIEGTAVCSEECPTKKSAATCSNSAVNGSVRANMMNAGFWRLAQEASPAIRPNAARAC